MGPPEPNHTHGIGGPTTTKPQWLEPICLWTSYWARGPGLKAQRQGPGPGARGPGPGAWTKVAENPVPGPRAPLRAPGQ